MLGVSSRVFNARQLRPVESDIVDAEIGISGDPIMADRLPVILVPENCVRAADLIVQKTVTAARKPWVRPIGLFSSALT